MIMNSLVSLLLLLLAASANAHVPSLHYVRIPGTIGRRLNRDSPHEHHASLRLGSISLTAINGQPLLESDSLTLRTLLDSLVIKVKVLSVNNTLPSATLNANLTRHLAPANNILSIFFANDPNRSAYTFDDTTGLVSIDPVMNPIVDKALSCRRHLTPFDFCPLLKSNVMLMKVGLVGFLDPLGTLNVTSAAQVIRKATLKGLIGSTLDVQVGKPDALDAYFSKLSGSRRSLADLPLYPPIKKVILTPLQARSPYGPTISSGFDYMRSPPSYGTVIIGGVRTQVIYNNPNQNNP